MSLPVVRPLGAYEQYSSSRHALGLYKNVITVCRYAVPAAAAGPDATPPASARALQRAVARAVAAVVRDKLPGLRVGIAGEATRTPAFVAVPSLAVRDHVEWRAVPAALAGAGAGDAYDAHLLRMLERETARPWADDIAAHPPWRVVVFAAEAEAAAGWADIAFAVHHALADGMSGLSFHTLLLETLNEQAGTRDDDDADDDDDDDNDDDNDDNDVLSFSAPPVLVPPQEALVPFTTSWPFLLRTLWRELGPAWPAWLPQLPWPAAGPPPPYTGKRVSMAPPLHGHLRGFHVAPPAAAALLAGCRARGVTLTALLHGLLLVLFARRVPAAAAGTPAAATFSCLSPVSLRPHTAAARRPAWLTPAVLARSLSNLVAAFHYTFAPDVVAAARAAADADDAADAADAAVWRAAAAVGAGLRAYTAALPHDNISGLLGWVGDWHAYWRGQDGGVRDGTWGVSSTGAFDGGNDGNDRNDGNDGDGDDAAAARFRITRSFYTYTSMGNNELVSVTVGGVRGGGLSLVVAWHDGVVADAFGDGIAADLRACLDRFCATGRFAVPDRRGEWVSDGE